MTLLTRDYSDAGSLEGDVRAMVTAYLEEPGRVPSFGVPKAMQLPVTLRVEVRLAVPTPAAKAAAENLLTSIWALVLADGRVDVRSVVIDAAGDVPRAAEVVELLPWLG